MKRIRVCGVQFEPALCDIEANLEEGAGWIERCANEYGADLVVFPETVTTGFATGLAPRKLSALVDKIPGKTTGRICEAARKHKVHVVWTTYEPAGDERVYNSAVLIEPTGEIKGVYRKIHPFPAEAEWTLPGNSVEVYKTDIGNIGMMICFDGDFPELARIMGKKKVQVIVRPSAFLRSFDTWLLTNSARAYDSRAYLVGVNLIGRDGGDSYYYGHSMILSPHGRRLAQGLCRPEIVHADLTGKEFKYASYGSSAGMPADNIKGRNESAYGGLVDPRKEI